MLDSLTGIKRLFLNNKLTKSDYIEKMFTLHKILLEYKDFIKHTDVLNIDISDKGTVFTSKSFGIKLFCNNTDLRSTPLEMLNFGYYEKELIDISLKLIKSGWTVFDFGANYGEFSLIIDKKIKGANVFAFEPISQTYDYLTKNISLNRQQNIKTFNFGFSDKKKNLTFFYNPRYSGNTSAKILNGESGVKKVTAKVLRLDEFVGLKKIKVDFIHCDVEGAELMALKGALNTLKKDKPVLLLEMLRKWTAKFGYHPNDLIFYLNKLGYRGYEIKKNKLNFFPKMTNETLSTNFFFLHTKKHAKIIEKIT